VASQPSFASVGEVFVLQLEEMDLPKWLKTIPVPIIVTLGSTIAFK
jgi:hypothetical protein